METTIKISIRSLIALTFLLATIHAFPAHLIAAPWDIPGGEIPGGEIPGGEIPGGEIPDKEVPDEEVPDKEVPDKEVPDEKEQLLGDWNKDGVVSIGEVIEAVDAFLNPTEDNALLKDFDDGGQFSIGKLMLVISSFLRIDTSPKPVGEVYQCKCVCDPRISYVGGTDIRKYKAGGEFKCLKYFGTAAGAETYACEVKKVTFSWAITAGRDVAEIIIGAGAEEVLIERKEAGSCVLTLEAELECTDGTTYEGTVSEELLFSPLYDCEISSEWNKGEAIKIERNLDIYWTIR